MRRFSKFSCRLVIASGLYGMSPLPPTMPSPPGAAPMAPVTSVRPAYAACGSMFQWADETACQMPLRSGLPSDARGNSPDCACPVPPATSAPSAAAAAAAPILTFRLRRSNM